MSNSLFWEGVTYPAATFNSQFNTYLMRGSSAIGYALAGYYRDFDIVSLSANTIVVGPGAAFVGGYFYVSDENISLTTSTAGGVPRSDMICLTYDNGTQTVRMTLTEGSVAPSGFQLLLYTIYRPVGQAAPVDLDIADKRVFAVGQDYLNYYNMDNLIPNSEFMAFSGISTAGADAPDYWYTIGAPTAIATAAVSGVYTSFRRGRAIQITGNAGTGMGISVPWVQNYAYRQDYEIVTLTGKVVIAGGAANIKLSILSAPGTASANNDEKELTMYATGDFVLRVKYNTVTAAAVHINILLTCAAAGSDITFGPIKACFGYVPGTVDNSSNGILMFNDVVTDANWNGTVGYSTGTSTINLDTAFSNIAPIQVKAAILRIRIRDSGSAGAAACNLQAVAQNSSVYGIVDIAGRTNDQWMERIIYMPVNTEWNNSVLNYPANVRFTIGRTATGVGTMDIYIGVIGFIV